jgi:serine/threonine protein kinase
MREFIKKCLIKDKDKRPEAISLLKDSFLKQQKKIQEVPNVLALKIFTYLKTLALLDNRLCRLKKLVDLYKQPETECLLKDNFDDMIE